MSAEDRKFVQPIINKGKKYLICPVMISPRTELNQKSSHRAPFVSQFSSEELYHTINLSSSSGAQSSDSDQLPKQIPLSPFTEMQVSRDMGTSQISPSMNGFELSTNSVSVPSSEVLCTVLDYDYSNEILKQQSDCGSYIVKLLPQPSSGGKKDKDYDKCVLFREMDQMPLLDRKTGLPVMFMSDYEHCQSEGGICIQAEDNEQLTKICSPPHKHGERLISENERETLSQPLPKTLLLPLSNGGEKYKEGSKGNISGEIHETDFPANLHQFSSDSSSQTDGKNGTSSTLKKIYSETPEFSNVCGETSDIVFVSETEGERKGYRHKVIKTHDMTMNISFKDGYISGLKISNLHSKKRGMNSKGSKKVNEIETNNDKDTTSTTHNSNNQHNCELKSHVGSTKGMSFEELFTARTYSSPEYSGTSCSLNSNTESISVSPAGSNDLQDWKQKQQPEPNSSKTKHIYTIPSQMESHQLYRRDYKAKEMDTTTAEQAGVFSKVIHGLSFFKKSNTPSAAVASPADRWRERSNSRIGLNTSSTSKSEPKRKRNSADMEYIYGQEEERESTLKYDNKKGEQMNHSQYKGGQLEYGVQTNTGSEVRDSHSQNTRRKLTTLTTQNYSRNGSKRSNEQKEDISRSSKFTRDTIIEREIGNCGILYMSQESGVGNLTELKSQGKEKSRRDVCGLGNSSRNKVRDVPNKSRMLSTNHSTGRPGLPLSGCSFLLKTERLQNNQMETKLCENYIGGANVQERQNGKASLKSYSNVRLAAQRQNNCGTGKYYMQVGRMYGSQLKYYKYGQGSNNENELREPVQDYQASDVESEIRKDVRNCMTQTSRGRVSPQKISSYNSRHEEEGRTESSHPDSMGNENKLKLDLSPGKQNVTVRSSYTQAKAGMWPEEVDDNVIKNNKSKMWIDSDEVRCQQKVQPESSQLSASEGSEILNANTPSKLVNSKICKQKMSAVKSNPKDQKENAFSGMQHPSQMLYSSKISRETTNGSVKENVETVNTDLIARCDAAAKNDNIICKSFREPAGTQNENFRVSESQRYERSKEQRELHRTEVEESVCPSVVNISTESRKTVKIRCEGKFGERDMDQGYLNMLNTQPESCVSSAGEHMITRHMLSQTEKECKNGNRHEEKEINKLNRVRVNVGESTSNEMIHGHLNFFIKNVDRHENVIKDVCKTLHISSEMDETNSGCNNSPLQILLRPKPKHRINAFYVEKADRLLPLGFSLNNDKIVSTTEVKEEEREAFPRFLEENMLRDVKDEPPRKYKKLSHYEVRNRNMLELPLHRTDVKLEDKRMRNVSLQTSVQEQIPTIFRVEYKKVKSCTDTSSRGKDVESAGGKCKRCQTSVCSVDDKMDKAVIIDSQKDMLAMKIIKEALSYKGKEVTTVRNTKSPIKKGHTVIDNVSTDAEKCSALNQPSQNPTFDSCGLLTIVGKHIEQKGVPNEKQDFYRKNTRRRPEEDHITQILESEHDRLQQINLPLKTCNKILSSYMKCGASKSLPCLISVLQQNSFVHDKTVNIASNVTRSFKQPIGNDGICVYTQTSRQLGVVEPVIVTRVPVFRSAVCASTQTDSVVSSTDRTMSVNGAAQMSSVLKSPLHTSTQADSIRGLLVQTSSQTVCVQSSPFHHSTHGISVGAFSACSSEQIIPASSSSNKSVAHSKCVATQKASALMVCVSVQTLLNTPQCTITRTKTNEKDISVKHSSVSEIPQLAKLTEEDRSLMSLCELLEKTAFLNGISMTEPALSNYTTMQMILQADKHVPNKHVKEPTKVVLPNVNLLSQMTQSKESPLAFGTSIKQMKNVDRLVRDSCTKHFDKCYDEDVIQTLSVHMPQDIEMDIEDPKSKTLTSCSTENILSHVMGSKSRRLDRTGAPSFIEILKDPKEADTSDDIRPPRARFLSHCTNGVGKLSFRKSVRDSFRKFQLPTILSGCATGSFESADRQVEHGSEESCEPPLSEDKINMLTANCSDESRKIYDENIVPKINVEDDPNILHLVTELLEKFTGLKIEPLKDCSYLKKGETDMHNEDTCVSGVPEGLESKQKVIFHFRATIDQSTKQPENGCLGKNPGGKYPDQIKTCNHESQLDRSDDHIPIVPVERQIELRESAVGSKLWAGSCPIQSPIKTKMRSDNCISSHSSGWKKTGRFSDKSIPFLNWRGKDQSSFKQLPLSEASCGDEKPSDTNMVHNLASSLNREMKQKRLNNGAYPDSASVKTLPPVTAVKGKEKYSTLHLGDRQTSSNECGTSTPEPLHLRHGGSRKERRCSEENGPPKFHTEQQSSENNKKCTCRMYSPHEVEISKESIGLEDKFYKGNRNQASGSSQYLGFSSQKQMCSEDASSGSYSSEVHQSLEPSYHDSKYSDLLETCKCSRCISKRKSFQTSGEKNKWITKIYKRLNPNSRNKVRKSYAPTSVGNINKEMQLHSKGRQYIRAASKEDEAIVSDKIDEDESICVNRKLTYSLLPVSNLRSDVIEGPKETEVKFVLGSSRSLDTLYDAKPYVEIEVVRSATHIKHDSNSQLKLESILSQFSMSNSDMSLTSAERLFIKSVLKPKVYEKLHKYLMRTNSWVHMQGQIHRYNISFEDLELCSSTHNHK